MNKCVSCGYEIPPQTRFCGNCGTVQPTGTDVDEAGSLETVSATPRLENTPSSVPPPPPQKNNGVEASPFNSGDNRPNINAQPVQANNQPGNPHPQTFYGDNQPPPQPYGNYQQPYNDYQQSPQPQPPQQPYGNYQQPPQPYSDYQQPQLPYGNYQQIPTPQPQLPYSNYQQTPQPQSPYGDYQPIPQPQPVYNNYQQPLPQPSGIHTTETVANPGVGTMGPTSTTPMTKSSTPAWGKWVIIGIVLVVILGASGLLLHFLVPSTPAFSPTISVTSTYHDNGTPAAANGTTLHVNGQKFATNSAITFLLDNATVRQDMQTVSDSKGNFSTDLAVTSAWANGNHTLTAHDASNNTTASGSAVSIIQQGNDGTPGPNGSPSNTATFKIAIELHMQSFADTYELDVTGRSDSQGGAVCAPGDDGSQQKSSQTLSDGTVINEVSTYTCSGTYKAGQVTYDDTLNTRVYSDDTGDSCSLNTEQTSYIQITGTYMTSQQFSGDITLSAIGDDQYTCTGLTNPGTSGDTGTWTGTVSNG
jgi:hypothetical protein